MLKNVLFFLQSFERHQRCTFLFVATEPTRGFYMQKWRLNLRANYTLTKHVDTYFISHVHCLSNAQSLNSRILKALKLWVRGKPVMKPEEKVIQKFLQNFSESKILKDLLVLKSSVHRIILTYKKDGRIERKKRWGRAPKTTEKPKTFLRHLSVMYPKLTSKELKNDWADGYKYHASSIRRILLKYGLSGEGVSKKSFDQEKGFNSSQMVQTEKKYDSLEESDIQRLERNRDMRQLHTFCSKTERLKLSVQS